MKLNKTQTNKVVVEVPKTQHGVQNELLQQKSEPELTFGQRLADKMTAKIGSWAFLTAQSAVLTVWITLNSIPGVPHWDENPFILLNLVFSFASAYTAPVVLMSQNRQSEEDRKIAEADHKVNVTAAQNVELLHAKIDALQEDLLKKQQQRLKEIQEQQQHLKETEISVLLPLLNNQQAGKFRNEFSEHKSSKVSRVIEENAEEFADHLFRRS